MGVDTGNQTLTALDNSHAVPEPHLSTKFCFCLSRAVLISHEEIKLPSQSVCVVYYVVVKIDILLYCYSTVQVFDQLGLGDCNAISPLQQAFRESFIQSQSGSQKLCVFVGSPSEWFSAHCMASLTVKTISLHVSGFVWLMLVL